MRNVMWGSELSPSVSKASGDSAPKLTVESIDNHVYFYSGVDEDRCLALVKQLRELDSKLRNEHSSRMLREDEYPRTPIWLHVQSPGGGLFSAFAVADQLATIESPVYSVVEGCAASAGTILSVACKRRYVLPNAFMMIHQLSNVMWGKYEECKDEMRVMDMAMECLVRLYTGRTKMGEGQVRSLLKRDSWFRAAECVELGLADGVLGG